MATWCSTLYQPLSAQTRTVTISTCLSSASAASCASRPLLQAVVILDDYPATGALDCTADDSSNQKTCGTGMSIESWAFGEVPPTVTHVTDAASSACPSTKLVTVNGTSFFGATAVNFLLTSVGDTVLAGTSVTVNAAGTTVTACASSQMVAAKVYQVTVTTPAGTSATSAASSLTY